MSKATALVCMACGARAVTLYACRECGSLQGYAPSGALVIVRYVVMGEGAVSDPGATLHRTEEA